MASSRGFLLHASCFITRLTCNLCETVHFSRKYTLILAWKLLLSDFCPALVLFSGVRQYRQTYTYCHVFFPIVQAKHSPIHCLANYVSSSLPFLLVPLWTLACECLFKILFPKLNHSSTGIVEAVWNTGPFLLWARHSTHTNSAKDHARFLFSSYSPELRLRTTKTFGSFKITIIVTVFLGDWFFKNINGNSDSYNVILLILPVVPDNRIILMFHSAIYHIT